MSTEMIYLQSPGGQVIGMSAPLSAPIEKQVANGELSRVNEDGSPWTGKPARAAAKAPDPAPAAAPKAAAAAPPPQPKK